MTVNYNYQNIYSLNDANNKGDCIDEWKLLLLYEN